MNKVYITKKSNKNNIIIRDENNYFHLLGNIKSNRLVKLINTYGNIATFVELYPTLPSRSDVMDYIVANFNSEEIFNISKVEERSGFVKITYLDSEIVLTNVDLNLHVVQGVPKFNSWTDISDSILKSIYTNTVKNYDLGGQVVYAKRYKLPDGREFDIY